MKTTLFKKAVRPIVKQTKEVIAEELTGTTSKTPKPVEAEIVNEDEITIKVDKDILSVVCIGLGILALLMLRRKPDVKVYVIK